MDGSNRRVLLFVHSQPLQLVVNEEHLYWVDTMKNTLERVKLDGSDRTVLTSLRKPFGLAILDDSVFWSEQETGRIIEEQKSDRSFRREMYVVWGVPRGLAVVSSGRPGGEIWCLIMKLMLCY